MTSCVARKSDHLYGTRCPDRLNGRCDLVDIAVILLCALSLQISLIAFHVKGPLAYIGGKTKIAYQIIELFPKHQTFVEVFAGGAQVLFHKEPSAVEVLNDLDSDVVTFFRVCQRHYEELIRHLKFIVKSREWFELLRNQDPKALTDVERAGRFFFLQKNAYAGAVRSRGFGYTVAEGSRFNPEHLPKLIENTHKRLARVQIEHLPYQEVLQRYDRPSTLFFCDPPYYGRKLYNFNFEEADFIELAKRLGDLQGKFLLSLNDTPEVRRIFGDFQVREIKLAYTAQRTAGKRFRELLITNFTPSKVNPEAKP